MCEDNKWDEQKQKTKKRAHIRSESTDIALRIEGTRYLVLLRRLFLRGRISYRQQPWIPTNSDIIFHVLLVVLFINIYQVLIIATYEATNLKQKVLRENSSICPKRCRSKNDTLLTGGSDASAV